MAIALLSVGLLGVLVFALGLNVSKERRAAALTQHEAEADPKSALRKAIRAHGNCIEYAPMLSLMILAMGLRQPIVPMWIAALMVLAVASRFVHAAGILTGDSVHASSPLRLFGAVGTYLSGILLSLVLVYQAASLF